MAFKPKEMMRPLPVIAKVMPTRTAGAVVRPPRQISGIGDEAAPKAAWTPSKGAGLSGAAPFSNPAKAQALSAILRQAAASRRSGGAGGAMPPSPLGSAM